MMVIGGDPESAAVAQRFPDYSGPNVHRLTEPTSDRVSSAIRPRSAG
ncbi:hypothetical protein Pd630_LPD09156 (plasmid) [Rhodococcus opacus PD630]|nr:hypothetical protein Pd630_LPD09156 [Rhodococcus opacus PD630]